MGDVGVAVQVRPQPGHDDPLQHVGPECVSLPSMSEGGPSQDWDDAFLKDIVACLLPATADDRTLWVKLGHVFKRIGAPFELWHEYAQKAPRHYKDRRDCMDTWDTLHVDRERSEEDTVGLGTLCHHAKRDSPAAIREAQRAFRERHPRMAGNNTSLAAAALTSLDEAGEVAVGELVAGLQKLGGVLADLQGAAFTSAKDGLRFTSGEGGGGACGIIRRVDKAVLVDGLGYAGTLCPTFPLCSSLGFLHNDIEPKTKRYTCNVLSEEELELTADACTSTKVSV